MENQLVTITFFRLKEFRNKFWAFKMMQAAHNGMTNNPNSPVFYKLLGSGGEDGFSWKPNFAVYGILCVWDNELKAKNFLESAQIIQEYRQRAQEHFTIYLKPLRSHGTWSGINPFTAHDVHNAVGKVAVLTRATIRLSKLISFWREVSGVSKTLVKFNGRQFSIGVGEWPWIQQATFSIWDSEKEMKDYAYKNGAHKKIIQMTRDKKWYREEMFVRFRPIKEEGSWNGAKVNFL